VRSCSSSHCRCLPSTRGAAMSRRTPHAGSIWPIPLPPGAGTALQRGARSARRRPSGDLGRQVASVL
jgi:hypothetical protein